MANLRTLEGNHRETAHLLSISPQALSKAVKERGCPVKRRGGKGRPSTYSWRDVIAWRKEDLAPSELEAARTRQYTALAEKIETENAARRAELADVHDVRRKWAAMVASWRCAALSLPDRVADELAGVADPALIQSRLKAALYELLNKIADGDG